MPVDGLGTAARSLDANFELSHRPLIERRRRRALARSGARPARLAAVDAAQAAPDGLPAARNPGYEGNLAAALSAVPGAARAAGEEAATQGVGKALQDEASLQAAALGQLGLADRLAFSDLQGRHRARSTRRSALMNSALSIGSLFGNQALTNLRETESIFPSFDFYGSLDAQENPTEALQGNFLRKFFHH